MTAFAGYELLELAGSGGYFDVFKARQADEILALKRIKRHFMYDKRIVASLKNEARMLRAVAASPYFPKLMDEGEAADFHFIALEFIDGWTLEQVLERARSRGDPLPGAVGVHLLKQIAEGLQDLHRVEDAAGLGAVHGDIKPRNAMLDRSGRVKIIDLGMQGGTFTYMPLERLHDKTVTPYSDVYALGHSAYELWHGQKLYKNETTMGAYFEMRETRIDEGTFRADLTPELRRFLARCLNQEAPDRFQKIEEIAAELARLAPPEAVRAAVAWLQNLMESTCLP